MRLLLLLTVAAVASAERLEFPILKEGILEERLRLAHRDNSERYRRLLKLFAETGCTAVREQKVRGTRQPNLICEVPAAAAESPRKIIVGAHFDTTAGDGIIDNWSGAVLLPSLAQFMRLGPRRHAFEFVGFAAEEQGLLGSRAYLKSLSKEDRRQIAAVITMDCLGLTSTKCWPNSSNRELMRASAIVAAAMKLEFGGVNVDAVGSTDSVTFRDAKLPVLSLHSVTQETWKTIHSNADMWRSVSWRDYYQTHRFLSALLVYLDRNLP